MKKYQDFKFGTLLYQIRECVKSYRALLAVRYYFVRIYRHDRYTLKGPGVESTPLDVSRDNFADFLFRAPHFRDFFFSRVLRNFSGYFRKNRAYRSEVT